MDLNSKYPMKAKPLKVLGRNHYACTRCKLLKIKCSGDKPCSNCKNIHKGDDCIYPSKDRKVVLMESDLNGLYDRINMLEQQVNNNTPGNNQDGKLNLREIFTQNSLEKANTVQERLNENNKEFLFNTMGLENFMLLDNHKEKIKLRLLDTCYQKLPSKSLALSYMNMVYVNYAIEFYLLDVNQFTSIIDDIYELFNAYSKNDKPKFIHYNEKVTRPILCYFFIILAYGEQISNNRNQIDAIPGIEFYTLASELFTIVHENISLQFVQTAAIFALYSANLNRYNTVCMFFGVALRSALTQGYHRQPSNMTDATEEQLNYHERVKRLWWTLFIIDATWTAKMNMPSQIDYTDTDVDLPCENPRDLNDLFDINTLEINVHLVKYISQSVKAIYGANMRTMDINYINTDQFNQKLLINNILNCSNELKNNFEIPFLYKFKDCNVIEPAGRKSPNIFMRYNLLLILITKPLISHIFSGQIPDIMDNQQEIETVTKKTIGAAISNINILINLYQLQRIFIIGFYDSQYLFSSILVIIMTCITDKSCHKLVNKAAAILKHMANSNNINAQNCIKRLLGVNEYLSRDPNIKFRLDLDLDISFFNDVPLHDYHDQVYYNPYMEDYNNDLYKSMKAADDPKMNKIFEDAFQSHQIYEKIQNPHFYDIKEDNDVLVNSLFPYDQCGYDV